MVTAKILRVDLSYPSLQVEVAFSDDGGKLPDPTHLTYNIPIEQAKDLSTLEERVKESIENFETILAKVAEFQKDINKEYTNVGEVIK